MQVTDQLAQTMQLLASAAQSVKPPQAGTQTQDKRFRDLMQQKQQQTQPTDSAKPVQGEGEQTDPSQQAPAQESDSLRQQMELAAALAAQSAVVVILPQVEAQIPNQQQTAVVPLQGELAQPALPLDSNPVQQMQHQPEGDAQPLPLQPLDQTQTQTKPEGQAVATQTQDAVQAAPQTQTGQGKSQLDAQPQNGPRQQGEEAKITVEAPGTQPLFQSVDSAPIKVAAAPVLDTQDPQMEAKLTSEISRALDKGEMHVEMRLAPESLGNVVVELTRSGDGTLQVLLRAADPKAVSMLKDHAAGLSALLQSGTQANVQIQVQQEQPASNQQQPMWQQQGDGRGQNQREQQQRPRQEQSDDFLQQLRLGLVGIAT